jgi:L-cysteine:1D-myo-inositol 2-amino-2-deoxy-alpha-D-glucopyranoside ligase
LKLYNSLTEQIEPLVVNSRPVTLYVCGITPYDTTHLGHAFTYVMNDVLVRYLEQQGRTVRYVQNVTDIDDDILRKAASLDEPWTAVVNQWTSHFIRDMQALNVRPPDDFPRATSAIPQIIEQVQALLAAEVAYHAGGSVYYATHAWHEFGKLSHLPAPDMLPIANERGNNPDDPNKRHPLDFVLWQAQAPGEPAWESPWGPGRPGWHIECSTLATRFLGDTVDIHSGGSDLLFPHHECEIAQVEPVTEQRPFVRHWLHIAMVQYEGEKMSKSLGNLIMVRDLLQEVSPDAIRLYLSQHHYRRPWSYERADLAQAATAAEALRRAATATVNRATGHQTLDVQSLQYEFTEAMENDLDTPRATALLQTMATQINSAVDQGWNVEAAQQQLRTLGSVFGLRFGAEPEPRVTAGWQAHQADFQ